MLKRSVVIAGRHNTSITLEEEFMKELEDIAFQKKITINQLVTEIDSSRKTNNLSSAIRVYILSYIKQN
ncbi:MAG: ribbon-helix-helix domain-containing protein [Alphaproteobacteria bacterium]|nr:ribbon-helix-helix domain-containing protein [Alphaproteobacteria bacterium]